MNYVINRLLYDCVKWLIKGVIDCFKYLGLFMYYSVYYTGVLCFLSVKWLLLSGKYLCVFVYKICKKIYIKIKEIIKKEEG